MNKYKNIKGSITVFLTLLMLIVISLIMTTVEALRVHNMSAYAERALYSALDSVLAEFYYPLFKEYHVFGLDGGYGTNIIREDILEDKIFSYMQYTFNPNEDISVANHKIPMENFNLYELETKEVNINDIKTLMDYNGGLFVNQGVQYSKYRLAGDGVESLLENANIIDQSRLKDIAETEEIFKEKIKAEEGISNICKDIISLSKTIDGIDISPKGPKTNKDGSLQIKNYFVKKICVSESTISNPHPENEWITSSLQGEYLNPKRLMDKGISYLDLLLENHNARLEAEKTYTNKTQIDQDEINDEDELKRLKKEIKNLKELIKKYDAKEKELISNFNNFKSEVKRLINNTSTVIESAVKDVTMVIKNQTESTKLINNYKSVLKEKKDSVSEDFYTSLWNDYLEIEKYKDSKLQGNNTYNFIGMKTTLENNKNIMKELKGELDFKVSSEKESWIEGKEKLKEMKETFSNYSHEYLNLDYKDLRRKEEEPKIFDGANSIIADGIMNLVIVDGNELSEKKLNDIDKAALPSYQYKSKEDNSSNVLDNFEDLNASNAIEKFMGIIEGFSENLKSSNLLTSTGDMMVKELLCQKYYLDHFGTLQTETKVEMPTALEYEIEYILKGKDSDYDNLKALASDLLIFRMLMNTTSLMINSKSNRQAREIAVLLVGFTGIPVLVTITKTIILLVWGLAESFVDIATLLREKTVAIFKELKDFSIELKDLPFINKELIQKKVDKINNQESPLYHDYSDYLYILLLLKKSETKTYRALDMIQVNMQKNYEETFFISNCIYGIQVSSSFLMEDKFISLPFVQGTIGSINEEYDYNTTLEYSY